MRFASRALFVLIASCSGGQQQKGDLQVMSYGPQGPIDKAEPVEIKFDKPVVDEAMVGKPAGPSAVAITPTVAWKGFWQDRQTLSIDPDELAPSTRYKVALQGDLVHGTSCFSTRWKPKLFLAMDGCRQTTK